MARLSGWKSISAKTRQCQFRISPLLQLLCRAVRHSSDDPTYMESEPAKAVLNRLARIGQLHGRARRARVGRAGIESGCIHSRDLPSGAIWTRCWGTLFYNRQREL